MTGKPVAEGDQDWENLTHEWPTQLVLVNVPEEYDTRADKIFSSFRENHAFDEEFDPLVKSAYAGQDAVRQREMERRMETLVNGMVLIMLLAAGIFLLRMKVEMDLPELKRDYQFLEILGMRRDERVYLEKREVSRFVWMPLGLGALLSAILTGIVFILRIYQTEDVINYLKYGILIWGACAGVQFLNLKLLQREVVQKLEGDSEESRK